MPRGFPHGVPFKRLGNNPHERLKILRSLVMGVIKHERIEASFHKSSEAQKYVNRLIDIAKYGRENKYCEDMVEFWTKGDEEINSKLFDVLVPRYQSQKGKYTRMAILPMWHNKSADKPVRMSVLELKGNPLPPLPVKEENPYTLQNVLIQAAKKDWLESKMRTESGDAYP